MLMRRVAEEKCTVGKGERFVYELLGRVESVERPLATV
jgi:hypothetical protein